MRGFGIPGRPGIWASGLTLGSWFALGLTLSVSLAQASPSAWMDLSAWSLNGSAVLLDNQTIRLTDEAPNLRASAWSPDTVDLTQDFVRIFSVYLGKDENSSAGIGIIFQNDPQGLAALGASYSGEGFGDTAPGPAYIPSLAVKPSVDIEIDTYPNEDQFSLGEPPFQHLGIMENGLFENGYAVTPVHIDPGNNDAVISDGKEHAVLVRWTASTQTLSVVLDTGASLQYKKDIVNQIFSGVTRVRWGVTASTGGGYAIQSFKVRTDATWMPSPTPSPTVQAAPFSNASAGNAFIYPNPVTGGVGHLAYTLGAPGRVTAAVFNTACDHVATFEGSDGPSQGVLDLDLKGAAPGVYYVHLTGWTPAGKKTFPTLKIYLSEH